MNQRSYEPWESFRVGKGDILQFTGVRSGCRAYLAVAGGIDIPDDLESKSTCLRGNIGGMDGRALREGDEIGIKSQVSCELTARAVPAEYRNKQTPR